MAEKLQPKPLYFDGNPPFHVLNWYINATILRCTAHFTIEPAANVESIQ
jgi:hypothetical protein